MIPLIIFYAVLLAENIGKARTGIGCSCSVKSKAVRKACEYSAVICIVACKALVINFNRPCYSVGILVINAVFINRALCNFRLSVRSSGYVICVIAIAVIESNGKSVVIFPYCVCCIYRLVNLHSVCKSHGASCRNNKTRKSAEIRIA